MDTGVLVLTTFWPLSVWFLSPSYIQEKFCRAVFYSGDISICNDSLAVSSSILSIFSISKMLKTTQVCFEASVSAHFRILYVLGDLLFISSVVNVSKHYVFSFRSANLSNSFYYFQSSNYFWINFALILTPHISGILWLRFSSQRWSQHFCYDVFITCKPGINGVYSVRSTCLNTYTFIRLS